MRNQHTPKASSQYPDEVPSIANGVRRRLIRAIIKIKTYGILHMPEPVATKMLATIPASDYDNMVSKPFSFQHVDDYLASAGFSVIIFDRP